MSTAVPAGTPGDVADEPKPRRWPTLESTLSLATGVVAASGIAVYAIMRYSYQEFYNRFGLTPDDVGPSSAGALTQSGAGVAEFVFLFAVLPLLLGLIASAAVGRGIAKLGSGTRGAAARAVVEVATAIAVYRLYSHFTHGHLEWQQLTVVGLAVLLLAGRRHRPDATPYPPVRWIVALAAIGVGAHALWASLPKDARRTAECAVAHPGEPVRFVHTHRTLPGFEHVGVIRVRADPARVERLDGGSPPWLPAGPLVYLGSAGGRDFVYAVSSKRTLQIPDGSVVLLTTPNGTHCHWWVHGIA